MSRKGSKATVMGNVRAAKPDYTLYTDGGCSVNPGGTGGCAAVLINNSTEEETEYWQGYISTTNNRMEIKAIIMGLENIPNGSSVRLYSDSQYALKCMSGEWRKEKNRDLWKDLEAAAYEKIIELRWVRGHNGNPYNERCDELATLAMNRPDKIHDTEYEANKEAGREFYRNAVEEHEKRPAGGAMGVSIKLPEGMDDPIPNIAGIAAFAEKQHIHSVCAKNIANFYGFGGRNFKAYMGIKSGGMDGYSKKKAEELAEKMPQGNLRLQTVREYISDGKDVDAAMRWHARGLTLHDSIRKVLVDCEVRENCR